MTLLAEYRDARRDEDVSRLRRVLALRAMVVTGMSQRQIAEAIGITQPAVSQQLKFAPELNIVHPEVLLEAAAPILKALAADHGYSRLAVFGSVGRHQARQDSDIDLIVESPEKTSSFGFIRFKQLIEQVLGRDIDLIDYGGLKSKIDDDIRREAVAL
ncbi:MAG: nucleotidyltransferase domain-containing protein [Candidatus Nanopelagicales bacterium]|nr:nucleotidyltransferase domain-containing protein [Candidatus Nanopelagicales bacterium]